MSVFTDAIRVLEERGWTQGRMIGDDGALCLVGAVNQASTGHPLLVGGTDETFVARDRACSALLAVTDRLPVMFNDDPRTTYEDVVLALKRAHELAEAE